MEYSSNTVKTHDTVCSAKAEHDLVSKQETIISTALAAFFNLNGVDVCISFGNEDNTT